MSAAGAPLARVPISTLAAYGLFGRPLAVAALPLYVHLPKFYGDHLSVNLAVLGSVLLVLRLADGVVDPLLGARASFSRSTSSRVRQGCRCG
jgi:GPH family glycoside/pentoside/hexuronide:cation symporter